MLLLKYLSKYNSIENIDTKCCVSLTDHATNASCFNTNAGVKFFDITQSAEGETYNITVVPDGGWIIGKIYKLQIRLVKKDALENIIKPGNRRSISLKITNNSVANQPWRKCKKD